MIKNTSRCCPKWDKMYMELTIAKANLGEGIHANIMCPDGHKWTEFYSLNYNGYWSEGKIYNNDGYEQIQ